MPAGGDRLRSVAVVGDGEGTALTTSSVIGCGTMQELHTWNADKTRTQAAVLARALCALAAQSRCVIGCSPLQEFVILSGQLST